MKKIQMLFISAILLTVLLSGCKGEMAVSSEEIVSNVLSAKENNLSYYGEGVMKLTANDDVTENFGFKEYVAEDGKRKMITTDLTNNHESYALNDGNQIISYETGSEKAFSIDLSGEELPAFSASPKEQLMTMFGAIKETHDYEIIGEEKLLDLDVYHLKATPYKDGSFLGEIDIWVDQKTWFMVKFISVVGDAKSEVEYSLLDFSPNFEENTFSLDIPEDVTITPIDSDLGPTYGTVEDAQTALEEPFLVFAGDENTIENVEITNSQGEINRTEITVFYMSQDIPSVLVSVFKTPKESGLEIQPGTWKVRGKDAEFDEFINALTWDEGGLRYTAIIQNPDLAVEEVIKMTENMVLSNEM